MPQQSDPAALDEVFRLCAEINRLRDLLDQLISRCGIDADLKPIKDTIAEVEAGVRKKIGEAHDAALARINLNDEQYIFMRAIDGDTIEIEPPDELSKWMRDIHVRFYGVDTPESNHAHGLRYTRITDRLCSLNKRRLRIVWERERRGTEYEGYPLASFERGIGNVFVDLPGDNLLYINAVLASMPHVTIDRNMKPLLKGARHFRHMIEELGPLQHHFLWPHRQWPTQRWMYLLKQISKCDEDIHDFFYVFSPSRWWHAVPWVLPQSVASESENALAAFQSVLEPRLSECGCAACDHLSHFIKTKLPQHIGAERVSVFDLLLAFAHDWSM